MATLYNNSIVTDGLVLCLDAINQRSYPGTGSTWFDITRNKYDGTLVDGPTYSSSGIPRFNFDGLNDRIHISSPNDLFAWTPSGNGNNSLSVEAWFKTSENIGNVVSKPWNGNGEYNYRILPNQFLNSVGNQGHTMNFTSIANGKWNQCVGILTPTQKAIYVNGILNVGFTNHSITNNIPAGSNNNLPLCVMSLYPYGPSWAGNTDFSILGDFAILKIYNRVLSTSEVLQNYNSTRGRFNL